MIRTSLQQPVFPATALHGTCPARSAARGFSITETMVTVAVLVILVGLATPSFREIILAQGVKTASFDVFAGLILARSEAVSRNTTVTIAPSGGNWSEGWTISDSSGEVVRRQDRMPQVIISGPTSVTYNGAGRVTTGGTSISLMANGGRVPHARCISIDLSGRPVQKQERCL
ncbi:MAG: GspH/FimT family pseudopilin [Burkholderiales bacterium]